ncbi:MAG: hypothetical protein R2749_29380 [Acidimicrobiales bacterium]
MGDRKLAGVLTESSVRGGRVDALVIGMGLNVNWPDEVPVELGELAVALNQLAGRTVDRVALAIALVTGFDAELAMLEGPGGEQAVLAAYRAASATVGRTVRLELPDGPVVGQGSTWTTTATSWWSSTGSAARSPPSTSPTCACSDHEPKPPVVNMAVAYVDVGYGHVGCFDVGRCDVRRTAARAGRAAHLRGAG